MTEAAPGFLLNVVHVTDRLHHNPGRMLLIVRRQYAHLEHRLRQVFEGRDDVQVILDRRHGERRARRRADQPERRRADRRTSKEQILEIVLEGEGE
jgi:hypothetical protein